MKYCTNCIRCETHTVTTASVFYCSARRMYINSSGCCTLYAPKTGYNIKIDEIFETTPITEELLKMPPADGSTIPKELWKTGNIQIFVNEDSISRKQAIKKVKAYKISAPTDGVEKVINAVIDAIARSIAELPSADVVEIQHGRWIDVNGDRSVFKCSVCGEISCCNSPFCGNCGARMEEE